MTQNFSTLWITSSHFPDRIWWHLECCCRNDNECFDLITAEDDGLNDDYYNRLRENIMKAPTYMLAESHESQIVEQFTT